MTDEKIFKILKFWRYPKYLKFIWWKHIVPCVLKGYGVKLSSDTIFYGLPIISLASKSKIEIGARSVICSDPEMTAMGVNHPVVLRTLRENACLFIGSDTGISGATICAADSVQIGNECLIGANVTIVDTDFHPIDSNNRRYNTDWGKIESSPVVIEDNVFVGAGALILKGVRIGKNSVVGAGSVVTKNIPENSIVAGNPAKAIR